MNKLIGSILERFGLKRQGLKVYFFFLNTWTGLVDRSRKAIIPRLVRRRSANGVYAIDLDSDWLGLGARIVKTLEILLYCEEKGLTPLIRYNYREKIKGTDYFGELFRYTGLVRDLISGSTFTGIRDIDELGWPEDYNRKLRLETAKSLFDRHLAVNPQILAEVEQFCGDTFHGKKALGVHYRGTDKAGEAPLVTQEQFLHRIKGILSERPDLELIFLSTDDEKIIRFLMEADLHLPVLYREDAVRSLDGDQFHRKKEVSKSVVNKDAIINMLILSRCAHLLKTASILSDCSVIFKPDIEVTLINRPHSEGLIWWPCREIINIQSINEELCT
jgi:hypothetical protein